MNIKRQFYMPSVYCLYDTLTLYYVIMFYLNIKARKWGVWKSVL